MNLRHVTRTAAIRAAVFAGAFGMSAAVGLSLTLWGRASIALEVAVLLGLGEAVTLCAAEWASPSPNGAGPSAVLGAAAGVGTIVPALPYTFLTGQAAAWCSAAAAVLLTFGITAVEASAPDRGWRQTAAGTYGVVAAVFAVILAASWIMRGRV